MIHDYPIKYAVIPMIGFVGYNYIIGEREYDTVAYIASKCYLTGTYQEYKSGKTDIKHYVVFPFKDNDTDYNDYDYERIIPKYNIYGQCYNSIEVDCLFDTFEEAHAVAQTKNKELKKLNYTEYYSKLEELVEETTNDLIVNYTHQENTILIHNKFNKVINRSLYDIMKMDSYENFLVFHVSDKKLIEIKKDLQTQNQKNVIEKNQKNLLLSNNAKKKITQIFDYENKFIQSGCYVLKNQLNNKKLYYDKNMKAITTVPTFHIYTTETFEDIIKSYINFLQDDEITINGKRFAKRIKLK